MSWDWVRLDFTSERSLLLRFSPHLLSWFCLISCLFFRSYFAEYVSKKDLSTCPVMSNNCPKIRRNASPSTGTRQGPLRATQQFGLQSLINQSSPSRKPISRRTPTPSSSSKNRQAKARSHSETGFVSDRRSPTSAQKGTLGLHSTLQQYICSLVVVCYVVYINDMDCCREFSLSLFSSRSITHMLVMETEVKHLPMLCMYLLLLCRAYCSLLMHPRRRLTEWHILLSV